MAVAVGVIGLFGVGVMIIEPLTQITRVWKVAVVLGREQEPFWLTGGNDIALSNLGITLPSGAGWCENSVPLDKFLNDLCGYVLNINNGWHSDGSRPAEPTEGVPIKSSTDYIPYHMTRQDAEFIGAMLCNQVTFVFVRHHSARFRIDAQTSQLHWEDGLAITAKEMRVN